MLYGYGNIIIQGSLITIELALLSVIVSIILGLVGASAKIFGSRGCQLSLIFTQR